mmetsp:Transcript_65648/g.131821  ORF Transcript_65648/g.131821 Transcript_65648/m.131821 type:complete len:216 (+) Transcript_65648:428-1075(+)
MSKPHVMIGPQHRDLALLQPRVLIAADRGARGGTTFAVPLLDGLWRLGPSLLRHLLDLGGLAPCLWCLGLRAELLEPRGGQDIRELPHAQDVAAPGVDALEGHREELQGDALAHAVAQLRVEDGGVRGLLVCGVQLPREVLAVGLRGDEVLERCALEGAQRALEQHVRELGGVLSETQTAVHLNDNVAETIQQRTDRLEVAVAIHFSDLEAHTRF